MVASINASDKFSIGLTGGIGSGKSVVADLLARHGAAIIDTDQISHALTAAGGAAMPAIANTFGNNFLTSAGALDRTAMRERVFSDPNARHLLESILHPLIAGQTREAASSAHGDYLVYVVPLLVESGRWAERVDRILVVDCSEQLQIDRVIMRNQLSAAQVAAIMATQASRASRLAVADDVIVNDQPLDVLTKEVDRLHQHYLKLAAEKQDRRPTQK